MIQKSIGPNRYFCCYYVTFLQHAAYIFGVGAAGPDGPLPFEGHAVKGQQHKHDKAEHKQADRQAATIEKSSKMLNGHGFFPDVEQKGRQQIEDEERRTEKQHEPGDGDGLAARARDFPESASDDQKEARRENPQESIYQF